MLTVCFIKTLNTDTFVLLIVPLCVRWRAKNKFCVKLKTKKMKSVIEILKSALPVAIGVAVGMVAYEQLKKITAKASV